jgi:hypothetical protein
MFSALLYRSKSLQGVWIFIYIFAIIIGHFQNQRGFELDSRAEVGKIRILRRVRRRRRSRKRR